jgi:D-serine dehydratase
VKSELAAALRDVDGLSKGMPPGAARTRFDDLARLGWNVLREDLPLPVAVL